MVGDKVSKKVVIDVDGVLLDTHSALEARLKAMGYSFEMKRVLTYDFNKSLPVEKVPNWLIETADKSYDFYLNAPRSYIFREFGKAGLFQEANIYEEAIHKIKLLASIPDVEVIIATQSYAVDVAITKRECLLEALRGYSISYKDFIGDTKGIVEDADYIIEDCIENLNDYNCKKFLVDKPYNQPNFNECRPDLQRVESAAVALDLIIKELSSEVLKNVV